MKESEPSKESVMILFGTISGMHVLGLTSIFNGDAKIDPISMPIEEFYRILIS